MTPSSSASSVSPPLTSISISQPSSSSSLADAADREQRQKAVEKFMARAEISMVTRALRARLSYASYKATHNIPNASLRDLEAQTQARSAPFPRTYNGKRKPGNNNYYNNPATQGGNPPGASGSMPPSTANGGAYKKGVMAPPTNANTPSGRSHYLNADGTPNTGSYNPSQNRTVGTPGHGNLTGNTLYSSILAPPPAKHARTILNPNDPPLQAPARPNALESPRLTPLLKSTRSIAEGTRAQSRIRKDDKGVDNKRKGKQRATDKGKNKRRRNSASKAMDVDSEAYGDQDIDMKAAATLTSLLLQSRPSIGNGSPRSSISSEAGSGQFYKPNSARTVANAPSATPSKPPTVTTRAATPKSAENPPPAPPSKQNTPSVVDSLLPAPTDNEAADLMLFLATSPSPARQTTAREKDNADLKAYRALGGTGSLPGSSALKARGRVLFAGGTQEREDSDGGGAGLRSLGRGETSFASSSISSIGAEMRGSPSADHGMPSVKPRPMTPSEPQSPKLDPRFLPLQPQSHLGLGTPGPFAFNFNDFINVSPATPQPGPHTPSAGQLQSENLRTDVGRRLFEGDQMRQSPGVVGGGNSRPGGELGASISLVPSPTR